jgi:hypothetical protein
MEVVEMESTYDKIMKVVKEVNEYLAIVFGILLLTCFIIYFAKGAPHFDYFSLVPERMIDLL